MSVRLITLTTDFGLQDPYVGVMKGVIASIAPQANVIDLSHGVPPQDILAGAMMLEESCAYFPPGTIHVAVVDPGVGSQRAAVAIETHRSLYIGPDNGLFDLVLNKEGLRRAVKLENPALRLPAVSATFHGRDIFAPAAAHLAKGLSLESFGEPAGPLTPLHLPQPEADGEALSIHVLRADRFGNLVTDLTPQRHAKWNPDQLPLSVILGNARFVGISHTFSDVEHGTPVAYFGSANRLEIAIREGNAEQYFQASRGTMIRLEKFSLE